MFESKTISKLHKSSRGSPIRKEPMIRKLQSGYSRQSTSDRMPLPMKRMTSPLHMKRAPYPLPKKNIPSSRLQSIASPPHRSLSRPGMKVPPGSIDRNRSLKKYEKRFSPPPGRIPMSYSSSVPPSREQHFDNRYKELRPPPTEMPNYSMPLKKKIRREPEQYSPSSMHRSSHPSQISDRSARSGMMSQMAPDKIRRAPSPIHERNNHSYDLGDRVRTGPPMHKKILPPKQPYVSSQIDHYRDNNSSHGYASADDKSSVPSLHERFSNVETSRAEPRIRYSKDDLEKITIDIKRNLRQSPTRRSIINPADIKLVRRPNEGRRPMFDRDEIKNAPRDLRDDSYYEKKIISKGGLYNSLHSIDMRDIENYEITRHRFDPHSAAFHSSSGRSLSDRWQHAEGMKHSDQNIHDKNYERPIMKRAPEMKSESKSGDRDFRAERYTIRESRGKPDYYDSMASDNRSGISVRQKESLASGGKNRINPKRPVERSPSALHSESRSNYGSFSEKHYSGNMTLRGKNHSSRRSPIELSTKMMEYKKRSESREILPDFSRRPDKYSYKSWTEKPDTMPRGSNYFEHDSRETSNSYRGRGARSSYRGTSSSRSRGGFRGASRSSTFRAPVRGAYKGSPSTRGKLTSRRDRYSPSLWKHDLYSRSSPTR